VTTTISGTREPRGAATASILGIEVVAMSHAAIRQTRLRTMDRRRKTRGRFHQTKGQLLRGGSGASMIRTKRGRRGRASPRNVSTEQRLTRRRIMSTLVAVLFYEETTAYEMRTALLKMQKEHLIDLEDSVVVTRNEK